LAEITILYSTLSTSTFDGDTTRYVYSEASD